MKKNSKRYLVTFVDGSTDAQSVGSVLNIDAQNMKEGISFLATDELPKAEDVLFFENVGVTSVELSDAEVERLQKSDKVLAVEEDVEMQALEEFFDDGNYSEHSPEFLTSDTAQSTFAEGYDQALIDVFANLIKSKNSSVSGMLGGGLPILPRPMPWPPVQLFRQPTPWNIDLVKAPLAWARGIRGNGVKVAIIDTGIANHIDLAISGGVSFVPGVASYNDDNGHGTHCAGIVGARNNAVGVVGVAPSCLLYAVKVLGANGTGFSSSIIAGMDWCVANRMQVANMSLGGNNAPLIAYANAVKRCQDAGVTVVVATGNSFGSAFPFVGAPANSIIPGILNASPIAVGAIARNCNIASFSSRGAQFQPWNPVTCVAPGVEVDAGVNSIGIKSTGHIGNSYVLKRGTSMACPHVAGLAALIIQRFGAISVSTVKQKIRVTCTDLGPAGNDATYGTGLINCNAATL